MKDYGYKMCYREEGSKDYVLHFKTYTYRQALNILRGYIRYPPKERETGRMLNKPQWIIIPVTKNEIKAGIWRECPF